MTSTVDFDRNVLQLDEDLETVGCEILDSIYPESDPTQTIGFIGAHGNWRFTIVGDPDTGAFLIRFPYWITQDIKDVLGDDGTEEILSTIDTAPEAPDPQQQAAIHVLNSVDDDMMEEFDYHLASILSQTNGGVTIHRSEDDAVLGFSLTQKVFPADDGYSITDLFRAIQALASTTYAGVKFIASAFEFEPLIEGLTDPEIEHEPRYIQ